MFYLQTADNGEGLIPTLYMLSTTGNSFVEQPLDRRHRDAEV